MVPTTRTPGVIHGAPGLLRQGLARDSAQCAGLAATPRPPVPPPRGRRALGSLPCFREEPGAHAHGPRPQPSACTFSSILRLQEEHI